MLRYLTAGESHGKGLIAILEGIPSNLKIDINELNEFMKRRKKGFGRGGRQSIEADNVQILSGVRNSITLGTPITLLVENKDFENWRDIMDPETCDVSKKRVLSPRPGHADLVGALKFGHSDARNVLERASARETAIRVAVGGICKQFLEALGVKTASYVCNIGGVKDEKNYAFNEIYASVDKSEMRVMDADVEKKMIDRIKYAMENKDTLGGKVKVFATGLKAGLGEFTHYDNKIDAHLAFSIMSIQAIKCVEIGDGFDYADTLGSKCMDEIFCEKGKIFRKTNHAGGIEGGMTNGENIVVSAVMKPIPTLPSPLHTIDLETMNSSLASYERSDACAVTAVSVVCEAVTCFEIAKFIMQSIGKKDFMELKKEWINSEYL